MGLAVLAMREFGLGREKHQSGLDLLEERQDTHDTAFPMGDVRGLHCPHSRSL